MIRVLSLLSGNLASRVRCFGSAALMAGALVSTDTARAEEAPSNLPKPVITTEADSAFQEGARRIYQDLKYPAGGLAAIRFDVPEPTKRLKAIDNLHSSVSEELLGALSYCKENGLLNREAINFIKNNKVFHSFGALQIFVQVQEALRNGIRYGIIPESLENNLLHDPNYFPLYLNHPMDLEHFIGEFKKAKEQSPELFGDEVSEAFFSTNNFDFSRDLLCLYQKAELAPREVLDLAKIASDQYFKLAVQPQNLFRFHFKEHEKILLTEVLPRVMANRVKSGALREIIVRALKADLDQASISGRRGVGRIAIDFIYRLLGIARFPGDNPSKALDESLQKQILGESSIPANLIWVKDFAKVRFALKVRDAAVMNRNPEDFFFLEHTWRRYFALRTQDPEMFAKIESLVALEYCQEHNLLTPKYIKFLAQEFSKLGPYSWARLAPAMELQKNIDEVLKLAGNTPIGRDTLEPSLYSYNTESAESLLGLTKNLSECSRSQWIPMSSLIASGNLRVARDLLKLYDSGVIDRDTMSDLANRAGKYFSARSGISRQGFDIHGDIFFLSEVLPVIAKSRSLSPESFLSQAEELVDSLQGSKANGGNGGEDEEVDLVVKRNLKPIASQAKEAVLKGFEFCKIPL